MRTLILFLALPISLAFSFEKKDSTEKLQSITLAATVKLPSLAESDLKSVASGLRTKKVAFLNFDVYVAEFLVSPTVTWDKKPATFEGSALAGVMMTFLRDVPAKNISEAFEAGLKENDIKTDQAILQDFLKKVTAIGDIKKKEILIVARKQSPEQDLLVVEIPGRFSESFSAKDPWTNQVLKIWSGKPADSGIQALQKSIFN
jgi:hypothetical protein